MKQSLDIVELAQEIKRQQSAKHDVVIDTRKLTVEHDRGRNYRVSLKNSDDFALTDNAHNQIAARVGIPARYYDRMRTESPDLLTNNIQHWFDNKPERRMIRTLDNNARAFLSDRYKRIDNYQIASAALPVLMQDNDLEILSSDITSNKMYIQARFPRLEGDIKKGDPVQAGLIITNSEIGLGSLDIRPMIYRLVCTNGMVSGTTIADGRLRRTHLGARVQADEDYTIYNDDTLRADDHALMLKIRDSIKSLSDPKLFIALMDKMKEAADTTKIVNPVAATEVLGKAFTLPESERNGFLENLIKDQDYTKWGALNAVTNLANNTESYDRAIELEEMGGKILTMSDSQWQSIAVAA